MLNYLGKPSVVLLDAMGVIYESAEDVAELLVPFVTSKGSTLWRWVICLLTVCLAPPLIASATPELTAASLRTMIEAGNVQMARQYLLDHENLINRNCIEGSSPLYVAVSSNRLAMVKMLIRLHADVNLKNEDSHTPLYAAIINDAASISELLLANGADMSTGYAKQSQQPLVVAIGWGSTEVVKVLLQRGAEVNTRDDKGILSLTDSPLKTAVDRGNSRAIALLIAHGADDNGVVGQLDSALSRLKDSLKSEWVDEAALGEYILRLRECRGGRNVRLFEITRDYLRPKSCNGGGRVKDKQPCLVRRLSVAGGKLEQHDRVLPNAYIASSD